MNTKILDQLEFNKVKDQFTEYLQTEQAQAELRNLVPMTNPERIQNQFTEIQEMAEIFVEHHGFAIGSLRHISEPLRRLELDADLNIQELIAIKKVLQASADLGRFYADLENVELIALKRLFEKIEAFPSLQGSLQSINDGGFIEHFASPELQNIRRQLKSCDDAIRQTLQDILKKSGHMLAESLIASRNGRSVLTVTVLLELCMTSQALETQYISSHVPLSSLTKKLHNYVQTNATRWLVSCMNCLINSVHRLLQLPTTLGFWATWTSFEENISISMIKKRLFQRLVTTKHYNYLTFVTLFWPIL